MRGPWLDAVSARPGTNAGALVWRARGQLHVTVVAKATFAFVADGPMARVEPAPIVPADAHRGDNPALSIRAASDLVPHLVRAEVLFAGAAYAPPGEPRSVVPVRLAVFQGERAVVDKRLVCRNEAAFERMPIVYERAVGGIGAPENPVGVAWNEANVVDAAQGQRAIGLGPIARAWPARRRLLGATPRKALEGGVVELPDGLDGSYFQAAPPDQQIEALCGDEWLVLEGLVPGAPMLRTRLPSVRGHAWAHGLSGVAAERRLEMRPDTLSVDGDAQRCTVAFRVWLPVRDEAELLAARFVVTTTVAGEDPGEGTLAPDAPIAMGATPPNPRSGLIPRHGAPKKTMVLDPAPSATLALEAPTPSPSATLALPGDASSAARPQPVLPFQPGPAAPPAPAPPPSAAPIPARGAITGTLAPRSDAGLSAKPALPFERPGATLDASSDALAAAVRARIAPFPLAPAGARPEGPSAPIPGAPWSTPSAAPAPRAPSGGAGRTLALDPPASVPAIPASPSPPSDPPTRETAAPETASAVAAPREEPAPTAGATARPATASVRDRVRAALAAGEPLRGLDLAGADLQDLDLAGAVLSGMGLEGARLVGCKLAGARLAGAQLAGADLTGADLTGADLARADLARAVVARARFDDAILTDARLEGARGPSATFLRARAARASFARGTWDEAIFSGIEADGADFAAASVAGARFDAASLPEASFADARGQGAVLDGARLALARMEGSAFPGASFREVDAAHSVWEAATLDEARFAAANLKEARLARATCDKASFAGAELGGADLQRLQGDGADLRDARLDAADLRMARLRGARFDGASLRDVAAAKASLAGATFLRADLRGATLRGAQLEGANFAHAMLDGADLRDAKLDGANVFGATRTAAKLDAAAALVEVDPERPPEES